MGYKIREYEDKDKAQIFHLVEAVWGKETGEKYKEIWDWKLENAPGTNLAKPKIFVLDLDNKIVGIFCAFPVRLKVGDQVVASFYGGDLMGHPNHRGRAPFLFRKMMKEHCLFFGAGNNNAYSFEVRLGCVHIYQAVSYINIINFTAVIRKILKNTVISRIGGVFCKIISAPFYLLARRVKNSELSIGKVDRFTEEIDEFWHVVSKDYNIIVVRDSQYLNWRFIDYPEKDYNVYIARRKGKVSGYIVFRNKEVNGVMSGFISDVLVKNDDKETLQCLIQEAAGAIKTKGAALIFCVISPYNKMYAEALKRSGFIFKKLSYKFIRHNNYSASLEEFLKDSKNWFFTNSDSDLS